MRQRETSNARNEPLVMVVAHDKMFEQLIDQLADAHPTQLRGMVKVVIGDNEAVDGLI